MSVKIEKSSVKQNEVGGYSLVDEHSIVYKWEINKITSFVKSAQANTSEKQIWLISPTFSTGAKIKDLWFLKLAIRNDDELSTQKSWLSLHLMLKHENRKIRTKYSIFLLNSNKERIGPYGESKNTDYWFYYLFDSAQGWGRHKFFKIDEILENKDTLLQNDTLTVGIDLTVYDDYVTDNYPLNSSRMFKRKLSNDFEDLFTAKKNCDIKFQVGRKVFDAHKLILTTCSCVFDAMFSQDMKENKKNKINVPDVNPMIFEKVLEFIYTDKVSDLDDFAEQLLEVSNKYQLETLKELCEDSIGRTLSVENAVRILILADRHSAKQLVEFTLNYIVINFTLLKDTEEYKALEESHPSLFLAVLKKYAYKSKAD